MKEKALPTARELALKILQEIHVQGSSVNSLLQEVFTKNSLSLQDKAFIKELVSGSLRQRTKLDWVLNQVTNQRLKKTHPVVLNILRLGAYQLLFLQGIAPYAAVNESVNLARSFSHQGSASLVNAVLRQISRLKELPPLPKPEENLKLFLSINYSHPEWIVNRFLTHWGIEQTQAILARNNQVTNIGLRVNTLKLTRAECQERLLQQNIITAPGILAAESLNIIEGTDLINSQAYKQGWIEIQSECSQFVSQVLAPKPGSRVLDLCAGRGVKSAHLAQIMHNQGEILAVDINPDKLRQTQSNCRRLGVKIVHSLCADATKDIPIHPNYKFDRILIDAPCSGLGVLGRYPEARWQKKPEIVGKMQATQQKLLELASHYLANDGILVYATCSLEPEENEQIIEPFLTDNPDFQLLPIKTTQGSSEYYWRSWQKTDENLNDGFFIASISRRSES